MFAANLLLALASTAIAFPIATRDTYITGTNAGSIYSFEAAATARETFYNYGACGLSTYFVGVVPSTMPLVAMPSTIFDQYGASQHNTLCGKIITMTDPTNGVVKQAAIADRNVSPTSSIDMTVDLWVDFGQSASDGSIIPALKWSIDSSSSGSSGGGSTCKKSYTVVSGDYCYLIWTKFGITEAQLYSWNPTLDSACDIDVGQVLCVSE